MRVERVYFGSWTQRTNMHLEEVYRFLQHGSATAGAPSDELAAARASLALTDVRFHEARMNLVTALRGEVRLSLTEDGVSMTVMQATAVTDAYKTLKPFHDEQLFPALQKLFSRGAPSPRVMSGMSTQGTMVVIASDVSDDEAAAAFSEINDRSHACSVAEGVRVFVGRRMHLVDFGSLALPLHEADTMVSDLVFFREFERQLHAYLRMHRDIWERITAIRETRSLRYADFPRVRDEIMSFEKTLNIVEARLDQMEDILQARRGADDKGVSKLLGSLGLFDFSSLSAGRKYVSHLWDMTTDFADGTLHLLETLYQENTQRELNALKFITLLTALTSFFGMNIAFPWEERWPEHELSTFVVTFIVAALAFIVYWGLRYTIHNRRFVLREDEAAK